MNIKTLLLVLMAAVSAQGQSALACNRLALAPEVRARHFNELGPALRALHTSIRELPDGYEFEFGPSETTFRLLSEWVEGEYRCCPFFDISLRVSREGGSFWLSLTGRPGVKQFIHADFARWFRT